MHEFFGFASTGERWMHRCSHPVVTLTMLVVIASLFWLVLSNVGLSNWRMHIA
jgi:hypothetical protein